MDYINTKELARKIRVHAIKMVNSGGSSHIGSVLSISDILAVLYGKVMIYKKDDPKYTKRDRFILSKGHAGAGVYAVLAECGFFRKTELIQHYKNGSKYSGHVSHIDIPGVELSTGSLGHGLPVGTGMALAGKISGRKYRVFVVMSDGELDEGSNWESFMFASHHNLSQLTVVIDRNMLQSMKSTEETLSLEPLADKFNSFGWFVININGHNHKELYSAMQYRGEKPVVVIANTIKGKGVSYMENKVEWHYRTPKDDFFDKAMEDLDEIT